ncbi:MAG: hypothetical protein Q8O19_05815, partial [Rectinemataceae bacterium]|nr:hypothetical protein [Rectinemataceae bacterium]
MLAVQVLQLVLVELRSGTLDTRDIKCFYETKGRKEFLVPSWTPSKEREEVNKSLRKIAFATVIKNVFCPVTLREFLVPSV